MDLMQIRRNLLLQLKNEQNKIGIFTKGYEGIIKPSAVNLFVIPHNIGIIPRFCIIEIDPNTQQMENAVITRAMIDFDVVGMINDCTGVGLFYFFYNDKWHIVSVNMPSEIITNGETSITITGYPYGTSRSRWDADANYNVSVLG